MKFATRRALPLRRMFSPFAGDRRGAAAIEFAIVSSPFILLLIGVLQMGFYFMAQSALDSGVSRTAEALTNSFNAASLPPLPNAAALKAAVTAGGGGLINNDSTSQVEIRQLIALDSAAVPIVDGTVDYGVTGGWNVLVLRAQASVLVFAPGFNSLAQVKSAALVRRQGR